MKELFKNKLIWVVLILIILNLLSLGMLWCSHKCERGERGGWEGKRGHHKEFLSEKLNFTEEQKAAFHKLREVHFADVKSKKAKIHELKSTLMNLPEDAVSSDSSAHRIANEIGAIEAELEWDRFKHFQQVYNLCDDNQKKIFKDVIKEIHSKGGPWREGHNKSQNFKKGCGK